MIDPYDQSGFERLANEKRAAIGKPPVASHDVPNHRRTTIGRELSDIRRAEFQIMYCLDAIAQYMERAGYGKESE